MSADGITVSILCKRHEAKGKSGQETKFQL